MEESGGNLTWWIIAGILAFAAISLTLKQRPRRSGSRRRRHFDHKPTNASEGSPERSEDLPDGLTPRVVAQIRKSMRNSRKIEAIKIYRNATGLGLKESKEAVERDFS